jgi:tRNA-2-methylthio-N6-dimethylallyladenosine synthase
MKYLIRTFGCQMNQHDSQFVASMLENCGFEPTPKTSDADIIVINTCSVRESAENKILGFVDSLKRHKHENPALTIVVVGCMVSKEEAVNDFLKKRRHVDIVLGTRSLYRLPYYLELREHKKGPFIEFDLNTDIPEGRGHVREESFRAYITIMYGCDNFCSYCIVPHVRGREKSRALDDILKEARELVADGVKEIMLLGQNVNSYGKGLANQITFADLLYALNEIEGLERIRYMTSHPKDFSDETIGAIYTCQKVCRHFHLPFQAGSDRILKAMNRHYSRTYYLDLMAKIKEKFPDDVYTTDIIVGFPGETEADFNDTLDILMQVEFDNAYTFLYSPRKGTPAAKETEQVPEDVKKDRLNRLMALQNEISLKKNLSMVGKEYRLLGEGTSKNNPLVQSGRTDGNKLVHFKAEDDYTGKMVKVVIEEAHTWSLNGRILK